MMLAHAITRFQDRRPDSTIQHNIRHRSEAGARVAPACYRSWHLLRPCGDAPLANDEAIVEAHAMNRPAFTIRPYPRRLVRLHAFAALIALASCAAPDAPAPTSHAEVVPRNAAE